ncbi:MAG: hypothetical protein DMF60_04895 [Acidobacteria bacterium]|nr:MAG: hypothetical protein DMF60_04895 [Acidobacteriota bacterium]
MVKKSAHPDIELFDYLNGAAEAGAARVIEEHLSLCEDCTSLAALVRKLKEGANSAPPPKAHREIHTRLLTQRESIQTQMRSRPSFTPIRDRRSARA